MSAPNSDPRIQEPVTTMKVARTSSLALVLAAALLMVGFAAAKAQQQPAAAPGAIVIGIIDDQAVMQNSKAGKALQAEPFRGLTRFA